MNTDFDTIECQETITGIAMKLYKTTFHHLPIYDNKKLLGIVSARDFISYLTEYFAETIVNVSPGQPTHDQREGA